MTAASSSTPDDLEGEEVLVEEQQGDVAGVLRDDRVARLAATS